MCALAVFITPHSCLRPVQSCTEAPCISVYTGAKSTVGTLKPDCAFNVHKLLISSFILGHGVYERQCYKDCKLPCIFYFFFWAHHTVTAVSYHWGNGGADLTNKTYRPWPVTHETQTTLLYFSLPAWGVGSPSSVKLKRLGRLKNA